MTPRVHHTSRLVRSKQAGFIAAVSGVQGFWICDDEPCECEEELWVQCSPPLVWAEFQRPDSLWADRKELGSQSTALCSGYPLPQLWDLQEDECDNGT